MVHSFSSKNHQQQAARPQLKPVIFVLPWQIYAPGYPIPGLKWTSKRDSDSRSRWTSFWVGGGRRVCHTRPTRGSVPLENTYRRLAGHTIQYRTVCVLNFESEPQHGRRNFAEIVSSSWMWRRFYHLVGRRRSGMCPSPFQTRTTRWNQEPSVYAHVHERSSRISYNLGLSHSFAYKLDNSGYRLCPGLPPVGPPGNASFLFQGGREIFEQGASFLYGKNQYPILSCQPRPKVFIVWTTNIKIITHQPVRDFQTKTTTQSKPTKKQQFRLT